MTLGWGIFVLVLWTDTGELEDGAEVAPVSCHGAGDRGFYSLKLFFFLPQFALRDFFRSFGVGLFGVVVPRLAPWAPFFCRSAAGCAVLLAAAIWVATGTVCAMGMATAWVAGSRAGVSAPGGLCSSDSRAGAPAPHLVCFESMGGANSGCSIRYWRGQLTGSSILHTETPDRVCNRYFDNLGGPAVAKAFLTPSQFPVSFASSSPFPLL